VRGVYYDDFHAAAKEDGVVRCELFFEGVRGWRCEIGGSKKMSIWGSGLSSVVDILRMEETVID